MLSYLSFKPYVKSISMCVILASPLWLASLTNSDNCCHDNLPPLCCLHLSIYTFIQSSLFTMYRCISSQSWATEPKNHNSPILNISYNHGKYWYIIDERINIKWEWSYTQKPKSYMYYKYAQFNYLSLSSIYPSPIGAPLQIFWWSSHLKHNPHA